MGKGATTANVLLGIFNAYMLLRSRIVMLRVVPIIAMDGSAIAEKPDRHSTDCGFSEGAEFVCEPHQGWLAGLARPERLKSRLCGCENGCKPWPTGDSHAIDG
ncbi:hypothetical protein [Paraburkholderia sp. JPY419]|uniref:hypothetical protein n=1 Tax=Paraburkholderia sp. JPY419 TaxID=667660 RepID=UPI003D208938